MEWYMWCVGFPLWEKVGGEGVDGVRGGQVRTPLFPVTGHGPLVTSILVYLR